MVCSRNLLVYFHPSWFLLLKELWKKLRRRLKNMPILIRSLSVLWSLILRSENLEALKSIDKYR